MSVNIVNKTTGELTKVAGNVAPPTDSITNGDMRPVTSNAVYDAMHESFKLTSVTGETLSQYLNRFYASIDQTKLTTKSALIVKNQVYRLNYHITSQIEFIMDTFTISTTTTIEQLSKYILKSSGSKKFNITNTIAGVVGSSGVSSTYAISDASSATTFDILTLYY